MNKTDSDFIDIVKAAEEGDKEAQRMYGYCCDYGWGVKKDKAEAYKWYLKSAEQGDADAQYRLGWCYAIGKAVTRDLGKAVENWRKAAEQGHELAREKLDELKKHEEDAEKLERSRAVFDAVEEKAWNGDAEARYQMGRWYSGDDDSGGIVSANDEQAEFWFNMAAEMGCEKAQQALEAVRDRLSLRHWE